MADREFPWLLLAGGAAAGVALAWLLRPSPAEAGASMAPLPTERPDVRLPESGRDRRETIPEISGAPLDDPSTSLTGTEFIARIRSLDESRRERAILDAARGRHIPPFLWNFAAITVEANGRRGVFNAMPDYFAIGTNDDFVRMPMWPSTAQAIADLYGLSLPTKKMVDDAWAAAQIKLPPRSIQDARRDHPDTFLRHQRMVEADRAGQPLGVLTRGHQKDLVLTDRLRSAPGKVAIYGWHLGPGRVVQPLSTVHSHHYTDYSQIPVFVGQTVSVDGNVTGLDAALRNPASAPLFSDEGPITFTRYPT